MSATATVAAADSTTKPTDASVPEVVKSLASQDRIFIGNLPPKTKSEDVKKFLESFDVKDVLIPKGFSSARRGSRRSAFAFATLSSKEEVEKAVSSLNEKTLGENTVTVKVAIPKSEAEEKPKPKPKKTSSQRSKKPAADAPAKSTTETPKTADSEKTTEDDAASKSSSKKKGKIFKREPIPGTVSSEDTIFVSNIPFGTEKEQLVELFKDHKPQWAHISVRRVHRANGFSKYLYGFVKFDDNETQQKALKEHSEATLGNKKLRVSAVRDRAPSTADTEKSEESAANADEAAESKA